jgi:hypothetical protein
MSTTGERGVGRAWGPGLVRRGTFLLAAVLTVALLLVATGEVMLFTFTGWTAAGGELLGAHRLHVMVIGAVFAALLLTVLSLFVRSSARVASLWALVATVLVASWATFVAPASPGDPVPFLVLAAVLLVAHPAGRGLFRRVDGPSPAILALVALAAVPVLAFAVGEVALQSALGDDHALDGHYGMVVALLTYVLAGGLLAGLGVAGWRPVAWIAAGLLGFFAVESVAFPAQASSVGPTWGALALAWAVALVVLAELSRSPERSPLLRRPSPSADDDGGFEFGARRA